MAGVERGAGSREWGGGGGACVGIGVQVLVAVVLALEVMLVPVFRSWLPSLRRIL